LFRLSAVAVDDEGHAYVCGYTFIPGQLLFPVTLGPDLTFNGGATDAYVAKTRTFSSCLLGSVYWSKAFRSPIEQQITAAFVHVERDEWTSWRERRTTRGRE
jgi:hypothetical protein